MAKAPKDKPPAKRAQCSRTGCTAAWAFETEEGNLCHEHMKEYERAVLEEDA